MVMNTSRKFIFNGDEKGWLGWQVGKVPEKKAKTHNQPLEKVGTEVGTAHKNCPALCRSTQRGYYGAVFEGRTEPAPTLESPANVDYDKEIPRLLGQLSEAEQDRVTEDQLLMKKYKKDGFENAMIKKIYLSFIRQQFSNQGANE